MQNTQTDNILSTYIVRNEVQHCGPEILLRGKVLMRQRYIEWYQDVSEVGKRGLTGVWTKRSRPRKLNGPGAVS